MLLVIHQLKVFFRVFWTITVATAIFFCIKTTHELYVKYQNSPIIIKYEDAPDGLDKVPFPAITFNNELQFQKKYIKMVDVFKWRTPRFEQILKWLESDQFVA
jgi:hypothetical protein